MLLSEYVEIRERIVYVIELVLNGIEKREGIEFRAPLYDIACWVADYMEEFGNDKRRL